MLNHDLDELAYKYNGSEQANDTMSTSNQALMGEIDLQKRKITDFQQKSTKST